MVRAELINQVSQKLNLTKKKGSIAVNTVFQTIIQSLAENDKVELRGFGSFTIRQRRPRQGRNPKTGEIVKVPAKRVPFFKAGKDLKVVK
jgi:integration host factor subunit beta